MKQKLGPAPILILTLAAALGGFVLRLLQLQSGGRLMLPIYCGVVTLLILAAALTLPKKSGFSEVMTGGLADAALSCLGALVLAIGGALTILQSQGLSRSLGAAALLAGLCLIGAAAGRYRGRKPAVMLYVLPVIFYVVRLFFDFRQWMVDPDILDYCFMLFAMICFMLGTFHAASFCFDKGHRRALTFFSLTGVLFGAVSLAGADAATICTYGGSLLWLLACGLQAMRP